jgi:hypothetical protein
MQIYLTNDVNAESLLQKGSRNTITLSKGRYFDALSYSYLPDHVKDALDEWQAKEIKTGKIFIVYIKRGYWIVPANAAEREKY